MSRPRQCKNRVFTKKKQDEEVCVSYAFICAFRNVASFWKVYISHWFSPSGRGTRTQDTRDLGLKENMLSVCVHWCSLNCVNHMHVFCFFNIKI